MTRAPPVNDLSEQKTFQHYRHPTVESINSTPPPRRFSEFEDDILALMASQGVHGAFKERMLREVMRQDKCEYGDAYRVLAKMNEASIFELLPPRFFLFLRASFVLRFTLLFI